MIRILHLSYCDGITGAGIAAQRIHKCISDYDKSSIKSFFISNTDQIQNIATLRQEKFFPKFYNFFKKYFERIIIKIIKYEDNVFHSVSVFPSLKHHEINKLDIDIVHIHWVQHEMISIEEIGKINFPIVWTLHDCWPFSSTEHYQKDKFDQRYMNQYKIKKRFNFSEYIDKLCFLRKKLSWKNNISLIAPSKWIANCALRSSLMKGKTIETIPNPIDTAIFKPINKNNARKSLKINKNKKVILFGSIDGGLDPRKGADLLKNVLDILRITKKDFQLVIFGKKIKNQNIFNSNFFEIIHLGKINSSYKMATVYSAADIFVIPSRIESFGQTASEAQSCGTPVIGFDIGGLKDIVVNKESGLLIEPYNCKKMAKGIEDILSDGKKISKYSEVSRANALKNFNYKKVAKSHIDFYENILNYGK